MDVKYIYCRTERKPSRGCVCLLNCAGLERQGEAEEGVLSDAVQFSVQEEEAWC